jgi:hypothetical protein
MQLIRRTAAVAATILCLTAGPPVQAAPEHERSDQGIAVLHGRLIDDGRRQAGTVWYWIEDQRAGAPGTRANPRMGSVEVGADGRYEIRLSPASLPGHLVYRGHQVDLFLVAETGLRQLTHATSIDLRQPEPTVADFRFGGGASVVARAPDGTSTRSAMQPLTVPRASSLTRMDPVGCGTIRGDKHRLHERFMKVENWRGAPAVVTQGRASTHTLGVGVGSSFSGSPVKWHAAGTETVSRSIQESQSGIVQKWVWNLVNYQDSHTRCSDGRGHTTRYVTRSPIGINTAFSRFTVAGSRPLLTQHCQRRKRGYDMTKNTARNETVAGGVDIGPINVSAQSGWNEGTKYHVDVKTISWQCWSNKDGIGRSAVVQFRWRRYQSEACGRDAARCRVPAQLVH